MKKLIILLLGSLSISIAAQTTRPNIILFMVDDMGWQDTSIPFWKEKTQHNRTFNTPSMERLAAQGVKFTRAYAPSLDAPSRVSLMSGMSTASHRVTSNLPQPNQTDPDADYDKLITPRWNINGLQPKPGTPLSIVATPLPEILRKNGYTTIHIGKANWGAAGTPGADPLNLGFDINIAGGANGSIASYQGREDFGMTPLPGLEKYWGQNLTITQALTKEAKIAITNAHEQQKPFYLFLSHYAMQTPLGRDNRHFRKYISMGLESGQARYASLVEGVDDSLGEIMDLLEKQGISQNTIIIFISDNGGLSIDSERLQRDNIHNYPLNAGKGSAYEGGVRVPMILKSDYAPQLRECDTPVHIIDLMPTILDMAGVKRYKTIQQLEGHSLAPLLARSAGRTKGFNRSMYWHHPNKWGGPKTDNSIRGYGATSSIKIGRAHV